MTCATVMSIRIIDPSDPSVPYLSQCTEVPQNGKSDLCSLGAVDLDKNVLPVADLEVQVAIYARDSILDPVSGVPVCPADVRYDATRGFPIEQPDTPALGGRTFYHPGDQEILVTLGCTNWMVLDDPSCVGATSTQVTSTVVDFDSRIGVSVALANRLFVSIGEPDDPEGDGSFVLNSIDSRQLDRSSSSTAPAWGSAVNLPFQHSACIEVLEDGGQSTTALTCKSGVSALDAQLDLTGTRLARTSLQEILTALQLPAFPDEGLTIGIVVDFQNIPAAGSIVQATNGTVRYLSADRTTTITGATSSNGIFISTDAPYGTTFTSSGNQLTALPHLGGRVDGKVTIVILQYDRPPVGG